MRKLNILILSFVALVSGCGESADARYDAGYGDGYAEGYNTTLNIRATMVRGDWKDKEYTRGYNEGRSNGVADALRQNK